MRVEPDPAHYAVINGRRDDPEESTPIAAGDGAAHKGAAASHGRLDGDKARLALCVAALWLAWGAHDYLQERIFRHGFHQGTFMAFSMQTSTVTLSLLHEAFRRCASSCRRRSSSVEAAPQAPVEPFTPQLWAWYALISACIALTNGMSTAALNYVSMPTKVMIKSSKVLAVMLLGTAVFGTRYETAEYGAVALLCEGLMAFSISSVGGSGSAEARAATLYGMLLLLAAVLVDSLLPNAQQLLLQQRRRPKEEVVRHTNWMSALLSLAYVASTGELGAALTFLRSRPRLALLMALQNLAGYAGVLAFLETVQRFGSKVTSIATSTRKLMTIAISSVAFRHAFSPAQLCGILAVFGGLVANSYAAQPAARWTRRCLPPALVGMGALLGALLWPDAVAMRAGTAAATAAAARVRTLPPPPPPPWPRPSVGSVRSVGSMGSVGSVGSVGSGAVAATAATAATAAKAGDAAASRAPRGGGLGVARPHGNATAHDATTRNASLSTSAPHAAHLAHQASAAAAKAGTAPVERRASEVRVRSKHYVATLRR